MFTSKSFDLVAEEAKKKKKREQLYQPKRMRWMKYIAIPALVGFVLMLILCNVDFTYDVEIKYTSARTEQTAIDDVATTTNDNMPQESIQAPRPATVQNTNCSIIDCRVRCNGTFDKFGEQLESQPHNCTDCFDVRFEDCYFDSGSLKSDFFKGNFHLCSLEIFDCDLSQIEENTFQHESVKKMKSLSLIYTNLAELHNYSFYGLNNLKNFKLINENTKPSGFRGNNFLQPLATTLLYVKIKIASDNAFVSEPSDWFGQSVFNELISLDLADNTLVGQMNLTIFNNMLMLRNLNLANCTLSTLLAAKFAKTWPMLKQLDLSANHLTTLSDDFIEDAVEHEVHLELFGNDWNCSCTNAKLIQYIQTQQFQKIPKCASPKEFLLKAMNEFELECFEYGDNTTKTSTTSMLTALAEETTYISEEDVATTKTTTTPYTGATAPVRSTTSMPTTSTEKITNITDYDDADQTTSVLTTSTEKITNITDYDDADQTTSVLTTSTEKSTNITENDDDDQTIKTSNATTKSTSTPYTGATAPVRSTTSMPTTSTKETTTTEKPAVPEFSQTFTCSKQADQNNLTNLKLHYDAVMRLTDKSSSTVHITLYGDLSDNWQLFYMLEDQTKAAKHSFKLGQYTFVQIEDLHCHRSYLFCLVLEEALKTSPLNCRAHRLPRCQCSWFEMHEVLIVSLGILGIFVCTLPGIFFIYFLLRWRPTWLKGSKRLVRATRGSRQMLLFQKKKVKFVIEDTNYDLSLESNFCGVTQTDNSGNYQEIQTPKLANSAQMSPYELAPPTPLQSSSGSYASRTTVRLQNEVYDPNQTYEELI